VSLASVQGVRGMYEMVAHRDGVRRAPRSSGQMVRPGLAAGLAFMEVAQAEPVRGADLAAWFRRYLVAPGTMTMPGNVFEPGTGIVPLGMGTTGPFSNALDLRLSRIIGVSRVRVAVSLAGLLASPCDDRFLNTAVFTGRVERASGDGGEPGWRPTPKVTDRLSDIALSLFAADALSHREEYESGLCVCDVCGQVWMEPERVPRSLCPQHERSFLG
jgi:hypothetical protein